MPSEFRHLSHGRVWMHHGNAAQETGHFSDAITSYDQAIALLERADQAVTSPVKNMLGAAWLNRGRAWHLLSRLDLAETSVERAIDLLQSLPLDESPWYRVNLSAAWMNLANIALARSQASSALFLAVSAARKAVIAINPIESVSPAAAEVSLKTRRVLCDVLGHLLFITNPGESYESLLAEACDAVEGGLSLAWRMMSVSIPDWEETVARLFYFGGQLYRRHHVHFLTEYLRENLIAAESSQTSSMITRCRQLARKIVAETCLDLERPGRLIVGDEGAVRLHETWRALRDFFPATEASETRLK